MTTRYLVRAMGKALGSAAATLIILVASVAASAAQSSEGYVEGADGVRLFYRRVGAAPSVAILLHGGPGSNMNAVWPDLQPLADVRTIVMYDQRGGGRSQIITDPARLTVAHHVRDLEALRAQLGIERFALIGESWGAAASPRTPGPASERPLA